MRRHSDLFLAELGMESDELDPDWQEKGLCMQFRPRDRREAEDPELYDPFFDPRAKGQRRAAELCKEACPVMRECGLHALQNGEEYGVWGGMTERDRAKLRKSLVRNDDTEETA